LVAEGEVDGSDTLDVEKALTISELSRYLQERSKERPLSYRAKTEFYRVYIPYNLLNTVYSRATLIAFTSAL
jgi:hypothetical protein